MAYHYYRAAVVRPDLETLLFDVDNMPLRAFARFFHM